jgi:hypothetical protein
MTACHGPLAGRCLPGSRPAGSRNGVPPNRGWQATRGDRRGQDGRCRLHNYRDWRRGGQVAWRRAAGQRRARSHAIDDREIHARPTSGQPVLPDKHRTAFKLLCRTTINSESRNQLTASSRSKVSKSVVNSWRTEEFSASICSLLIQPISTRILPSGFSRLLCANRRWLSSSSVK